jgi:hypothetical protein
MERKENPFQLKFYAILLHYFGVRKLFFVLFNGGNKFH